jgi:putative metallohydrolase (TIGR04338 family)
VNTRDSQRSRVYSAEQFVRTLFDRAAQHSSRAIDFFGEAITLPPEARFASLESVARYLGEVLALPSVTARWPNAGPITVRPRRAATAAHYENQDGTGVIAVPERGAAGWAMRELVVLHELVVRQLTQSRHVLFHAAARKKPSGFTVKKVNLTARDQLVTSLQKHSRKFRVLPVVDVFHQNSVPRKMARQRVRRCLQNSLAQRGEQIGGQ